MNLGAASSAAGSNVYSSSNWCRLLLLWPQEAVWWSPEEVNQYESQHHSQHRPQYACHRLEEKGYNNQFCKDSIFYKLFSALYISSAMTSFSDQR